jgi:co-chaperonin GroES (HSP10)
MFTTQHVFVSIDKPLTDEIITEGGLKFYLDPRWNKEWNATVNGKVEVLPKNGYKDLNIGDDVAFSWKVVNDRQYPTDGHHFFTHIDTENVKEFISGKGERIRVLGYKGVIDNRKWVATYTDRKFKLIDGCHGDESTVSRWLSQFTFGDAKTYTFKNLIDIDKDYWKVKFDYLIAKKEGDEIVMLCDRILAEPVDYDISDKVNIQYGVYIPNLKARPQDRAKVVCGVEGVNKGDTIVFDERYYEKFRLWNKDYFLIKPNRVLGTI